MRRSHILAGLAALALACLAIPAAVRADDVTGRTAVGFESGFMKLTGGDRDYSNAHPFLDLDLRRGLAPHWSLDFAFKYGWVRPGAVPGEDAGFTTTSLTSLYTVIWQPRLGVIWHAAPTHRLSPFLGLSGGVTSWRVKDLHGESAGLNPAGTTVLGYDEDGNRQTLTGNDPTVSAAVGFDLFASANLAFSLGARYHAFPGNKLDDIGYSDDWYYYGPTQVDANKGLVEAFLGARLWFGSPDSRPRRHHRPPTTVAPTRPRTSTASRTPTAAPTPTTTATASPTLGDKCPDARRGHRRLPGRRRLPRPRQRRRRHPRRGRQVPRRAGGHGRLRRTTTAAPTPTTTATASSTPTTLPGHAGRHPGRQPGLPDRPRRPRAGPDRAAAVGDQGDLVLDGVNFISGSADLTPASLEILRKVAESLAAWPDVAIEIRGHTDDAGPAETNRDLSQRRALSVRDELIKLGISPTRLSAVGYGEDYPIADNRTPGGRAANRRVEIHRLER